MVCFHYNEPPKRRPFAHFPPPRGLLAGQCETGWQLACQALGYELKTLARVWLEDWGEQYFGPLGKDVARWVLGRDLRIAHKWDRFWAGDAEARKAIRARYALRPLGILMGLRGCQNSDFIDVYSEATMVLDDLCRYIP